MSNIREFIALIVKGAQIFQKKTGVFASTTIAQAILETGGGAHLPVDKNTGKESFNVFGIKGTGPAGSVLCDTWEVVNAVRVTVEAYFRAYSCVEESVEDHGQLLLLPRYKPVREGKTPDEQCRQLHPCGYATDPDYGSKLIGIIASYDLTQYDDIRCLDDIPSPWAMESVDKAKTSGVMEGDETGLWRPKDAVTREEMAVILDRLGLLKLE